VPAVRTTSAPASSITTIAREVLTGTPAGATATLPTKAAPARMADSANAGAAMGTQQAVHPNGGAAATRPSTPAVLIARLPQTPADPDLAAPRARAALAEMQPQTTMTLPGKAVPAAGSREKAPVLIAAAQPAVPSAPSAPAPAAVAPIPASRAASVTMEMDSVHVTARGETWEKVAMAYSTTPETLQKMNPGISERALVEGGMHVHVPQSSIKVYLDKTPITGVPDPYIASGYSMVPFRRIVEAKGGVVVWLPKTREINAWTMNNTFMGLKLGEREARINSELYLLPVAPALREARTMVPLRYLMSALRLQAEYNPETGTFYLVSQAPAER
jgi:hypothetical protein